MIVDFTKLELNKLIPIYIQIADAIEDDILTGKLQEGDNCYSQLVILEFKDKGKQFFQELEMKSGVKHI